MTPVLAGGLLFLAFASLPTPHLVWVALVPWLVLLDGLRGGEGDVRRAARSGAACLGAFWALNLAWMLLLVPRLGAIWPVSAYLGQLFLLTLLGAAAGVGIHLLATRARLPLALAAAVGWVGVEWARGHLLGPLRFPWSPVALPLSEMAAMRQPAAWLGETGLSLGVVAVNGLLAAAWRRRRPVHAVALVLLLACWWGGGRVRLGAASPARVVVAGVVQPGIPLAVKRDSTMAATAARESLVRLLPELEGRGAQVVVLPETHFTEAFPTPDGRLEAELEGWAERLDAALLVGGYRTAPDGVENAVLAFGPEGALGHYGKVALVPGVERTPGSPFVEGRETAPLEVEGRPGPLVCIESAWSGLARAHRSRGAGWLLNVTNDAWLAETPRWTRSPAFRQHPRHLVLRAVETGLGALRVGNNGLTGVVDPLGRWTELVAPYGEGVAVTPVESLRAPTAYDRLGDLLGPLAFLATVAGWGSGLIGAVRARRRRR